jgi:predicted Fe-Mo cluster-binding NifX family protein
MRIAFAAWNDRIAPVFDVTRHLHIVDTAGPDAARERDEPFEDGWPADRVARLAALGVDVVVCGAISRPQAALIQAYGIRIHPFVTGSVDEVVGAWRSGRIARRVFAMPGCEGGRGGFGRGGPGCGAREGGRRRRRGRAGRAPD